MPSVEPQSFLLYPALLAEPDRNQLWGAALQMMREQPLLGVGPGTFRLRYGPYLGLERWDLDIHSNNMLLEIGATTGLIGIGSFAFVVLYALWREFGYLYRRRASTTTSGPAAARWWLIVGLAAATAAFLVHSMVDYFLGFDATLGLFWAVLGIGLGLALTGRSGAADRSTMKGRGR
jgi:putative inorganic carbon (HCO3(-)) transporter